MARKLRKNVGKGMQLILNVAFSAFEFTGCSERTVNADEAALRLADLIDPAERTCRKVPGRMKYGTRMPKCSECGQSLGDDRWVYCPRCGGRIVE